MIADHIIGDTELAIFVLLLKGSCSMRSRIDFANNAANTKS